MQSKITSFVSVISNIFKFFFVLLVLVIVALEQVRHDRDLEQYGT